MGIVNDWLVKIQEANDNLANILNEALAGGGGGSAGFTSRCSVYRSTIQTIPTETWTKIQLNTEDYDNDDEFDNITNYRFQPAVSGYYHIDAALHINTLGVGKLLQCDIRKTGVRWIQFNIVNGGTASCSVIGSCDIYLLNTDYVELFISHNHGSNRDVGGGTKRETYMTIHRFA